MKEILFGMAVGSILGILLYKNNEYAKDIFDQSEKMVKKEMNKMEQNMQPNKSQQKKSGNN